MQLCECGCGEPAPIAAQSDTKKGYIRGQSLRFRSGHHSRRYDHAANLHKKYEIRASGCWEWTGWVDLVGYGVQTVSGKRLRAHRYVYEQMVGPIPSGLVIDHLCRNKICVNPAHLEPVTTAVNNERGFGESALNARKTHCLNGHEFNATNTRLDRGGKKRTCRICTSARARKRYEESK